MSAGNPILLFDLLGVSTAADAKKIWPVDLVTFPTSGSIDDPEAAADYLQRSLTFRNVQSGVDPSASFGGAAGQYALAAELHVKPLPPPSLAPQPQFFLNKLRDVGITLLATDQFAPARCFFVRDSRGLQIVIEQLPVRIILPKRVITSSTKDSQQHIREVDSVSPFDPKAADAFAAMLREPDAAIQCKARLELTFDGDVFIEPGIAISFGEAFVYGLPATAVYDFSLIPSLKRIERFEWGRHDLSSPFNDRGGAGFRSIDFGALVAVLKDRLEHPEDTEVVAEDVVVPFLSPFPIPLPSHGLFGIRRKIDDPDSPEDVFSLTNAPFTIHLYPKKGTVGNGTTVSLLIQRMLFRTGNPPDVDFIAEVVWSGNGKAPKGVLVGLDDDWTLQVGMVWEAGVLEVFEAFRIFNVSVCLTGLKAGISLGRLHEGREAKYCWELLADFAILPIPDITANKTKWIELRSLDGDKSSLVVQDAGWKFGKVHPPDMQSPKGMDLALFRGAVHLIVEAMGWVEDTNGASYFYFSGGISLGKANGKKKGPSFLTPDQTAPEQQYGLRFRRLRFRTTKHEGAPLFKVDGIFLDLDFGKVKIHGYGYITETVTSVVKVEECGFGVSIEFTMNPTYKLAASFLKGTVTKLSNDSRFSYFLAALSITPLPCGPFELSDVRMLFAQNLTPALIAVPLPLFSWYRKNKSALILPAERSLVAWKPRPEALSAGIGCGFSFASTSTLFHIDLFVFIAHDEEETGVLAVGELFLKKSTKAIAYVAIEYDVEKEKLGVLIGVDISIPEVFPDAPSWMTGPRLTGTLYFGNKPWTIKIGDLANQNSWLALRAGSDALGLFGSTLLAFCFQLVDGGAKGIGLLFDFRASGDWGIGSFRVWFSVGFIIAVWKTGSDSINATIWIEAGFSIRLFRCFHFGAEITLRVTYLGKKPWFTTMLAEVEIETPRWLPDVTIRFDKTWSSEKPFEQETLKISLETANALVDGSFVHLAAPPVTKGGVPILPSQILSFEDLAAADDSMPRPLEETIPVISTLATIALTFTSAVSNDMAAAPSTGDTGLQSVQELHVRHSLKSFAARRRSRFDPNAAFADMVSPLQTTLDASGNSSLALKPELAMRWDLDTRADGLLYPNRLLVNGSTPFVFTTSDLKADEEMLRDPASALCCPPASEGDGVAQAHIVTFNGVAGTRLPPRQLFSNSPTWWQWLVTPPPLAVPVPLTPVNSPIVARAFFSSGSGPSTTNNDDTLPPAAALLHPEPAQIIGTADIEDPASSARIIITIPAPAAATLRFEAYHGIDLVGFFAAPLQVAGTFTGNVQAPPGQPISRLVLRCDDVQARIAFGFGGVAAGAPAVIVSRIEYVTVAEAIAAVGAKTRCGNNSGAGGNSGKLAFLPNQVYEFELTSEMRMSSNSQGARALRKKQTVLFRTKGLPGLNVVANTGDELRPLIESVYPPPRVRLYRGEPVALAFGELMSVFMPLSVTSGAAPERAKKVELALNVDRVGSMDGLVRVSVASHDWLDEHRPLPPPVERPQVAVADMLERSAASLDSAQQRFDALLAASPHCASNPLQSCRVVKHEAPGGAWVGDTHFRASLRLKDGAHVDRSSFVAEDAAAFTYGGAAWSVDANGALVASGSGGLELATFGDPLWNHLQAHVGVALDNTTTAAAGLAVGINGNDAIVATIAASGSGRVLRLGMRSGVPLEAPLPSLTEPLMLVVHAFDDRVRAEVGDVMLEIDRGTLREGRIALVADGAARFTTLGVDALDMFGFDFATSRYATFEEHIASWDGALRVLQVAAAGGTPSMTADAWRLAHAADIAAVMTADADPQRRQALFADLTASQLLPLLETSEHLTLTSIVSGSQTIALLIESPEPLAFSHDVVAAVNVLLGSPLGSLTIPIGIAVLSNGDETAALLLPHVISFLAGTYELKLTFARDRWRDEASSAPAAVTRGQASLRFTL